MSYALRVPRGRAQTVKQTLGMPTEDAYVIEGLPSQICVDQVQGICDQMKWKASIVPASRKCRKGQVSCVAKSNDAPPCDVFPLDFAGRCFTVRVSLTRKTGEASQETPEGEAVPTTWSAFFAGRYTQVERLKQRQSHEESWANISASEKAKGDQLDSEHMRHESAERPPKRGRSVLEHFLLYRSRPDHNQIRRG